MAYNAFANNAPVDLGDYYRRGLEQAQQSVTQAAEQAPAQAQGSLSAVIAQLAALGIKDLSQLVGLSDADLMNLATASTRQQNAQAMGQPQPFIPPPSWAAGMPAVNPPNVQDLTVQGTDQNAAMLRSGGPNLLSGGTVGPIERIPGTSDTAWAQTQSVNMPLADWFRYQAAKGTPQTSYYGPTAGAPQLALEQAALAEATASPWAAPPAPTVATPAQTAPAQTAQSATPAPSVVAPTVTQPTLTAAQLAARAAAVPTVQTYISNLSKIAQPTAAQSADLAMYQQRLADYQKSASLITQP